MRDAPSIETPRLLLRPHQREDFGAICRLWADERVYGNITGKPSTREECWSRLLRYKGLWPLLGFGYWAIADRATGRYIGEAGLARFQRGISKDFDTAPEAGWLLDPHNWGRGLAHEAVAAILVWADNALAVPAAVCMIAPANAASLRIAEKTGFIQTGATTYKNEASLLFARQTPA